MMMIELNCDLGEGMGNDAFIMPYISACNIACGGHYGDETSIRTALLLAQKFNVKTGAHPSFEDRENFGRVRLDWNEARFRESVTNQLLLFNETANAVGSKMSHIKMHGALYHATASEKSFATWLVRLVSEQFPDIPIYSLPNSLLERLCLESKQPFIAEAFADRAYQKEGHLAPRSKNGSVLETVEAAVNQVEGIVREGKVISIDGKVVFLNAQTICIHGDNSRLMKDLQKLVEQLNDKGIAIGK